LAGTLIPIVPAIFVYGYLIGVLRQAARGEEADMQPWEDWGRLAKDGLLAMIIGLVFTLPAAVILVGGFAVYFAGSILVPLSVADTGAPEETATVVLAWALGSLAILFLSMFLGTVLLVLGLGPLPAALAHFAAEDRVGAAFYVGQWWPILWRNKLGYLVAWVVGMGLLGLVYLLATLAYLTICLCCLLPVLLAPLGFYVSLVACAVFGQTYREGLAGVAPAAMEGDAAAV
jgi:hypothetical protein